MGNHMEKILGGNSAMESSEVAVEFSCIKIFMALRHLENLPGNGQEVIRLPSEIIQTIAYLCYSTYSGRLITITGQDTIGPDDGRISEGKCNYPMGCAIDPQKNIYFTDYHLHSLRRIDIKEKTVSTIGGTGVGGFSTGTSCDKETIFNSPIGICCTNEGVLFIADYFNNRVRKCKFNGKKWETSTFAGSGVGGKEINEKSLLETQFNGPYGLCVDRDGSIILADCQNHRILRLSSPEHGGVPESVQVIAGHLSQSGNVDGTLSEALMATPVCVCFDLNGNLLVTDFYNHTVRKIDFNKGTLVTLAGKGYPGFLDGKCLDALFNNPVGICVSGRDILVADYANFRVRRITPDGEVTTASGKEVSGHKDGLDGGFGSPIGICNYSPGVVIVTDGAAHRIKKLYI